VKILKMRRVLLILISANISLFFISLFFGSYDLTPKELFNSMLNVDTTAQENIVLWQIRIPRALIAVFAGAGLAVASAIFQSTFRNRLADPGIVGIAPAAAFGALLALNFGFRSNNYALSILYALFLTWITVLALFTLERHSHVSNSLLIFGIAINSLYTALIVVFAQSSTNPQARSFLSLSMGSLATVTWQDFYPIAGGVLLAIAFLIINAKRIDLIYLSDLEIRTLKVSPNRIKIEAGIAAGAIIAFATTSLGVISFIGLLVPNIVKACGIYLHRYLLLLSALVGALLLLLADTLARSLISNLELPVSIFLVAMGVPFLIGLLLRKKEVQSG